MTKPLVLLADDDQATLAAYQRHLRRHIDQRLFASIEPLLNAYVVIGGERRGGDGRLAATEKLAKRLNPLSGAMQIRPGNARACRSPRLAMAWEARRLNRILNKNGKYWLVIGTPAHAVGDRWRVCR